ncbi:MAG: AI-2E family transporter [Lachnospiraceae bacterium]|nr:AI-2E family transporter [Lachnospiraceae bacterium]
MKFKWDKKYLYWGATATIVLAITVLFNFLLNQNLALKNAFAKLFKVMLPITEGFVIAFLINPLMKWFETSVFAIFDKKSMDRPILPVWKQNLYRILSILFSYIVILILIAAFVIAVIPQITQSITNIYELFPVYKANFENWINSLIEKYPEISKYLKNVINENENVIEAWTDEKFMPWLSNLASSAPKFVYNLFSQLKNFLIGAVVSIYVLLKKEQFKGQGKKIVYSLFNVKNSNSIINNVRMAKDKFSGFIVGKLVDSLIIGFICFIGCSIMKIEYGVLLALIIGVTNIIPFFGPIIGAVPCVLLLLVVNPLHSLYFLIFVIILQILDGNVIGPKILGQSTGISSFWVIFAITLFGGLWGIPGMIIGVPLMAVIYALIQSGLDISLKNKDISPITENYINLDHIDTETGEYVEKELPSVIIAQKHEKSRENKRIKAELKEQKKKEKIEKKSNSDNK